MNTVNHSYMVVRKFDDCRAVLVTAKTTLAVTTEEDLVEEIRSVVSDLCRKDAIFRNLYEYAGTDMNIGDLAGFEKDICKNSASILELRFDDSLVTAKEWHYDTSLCEDIDEDRYESAS